MRVFIAARRPSSRPFRAAGSAEAASEPGCGLRAVLARLVPPGREGPPRPPSRDPRPRRRQTWRRRPPARTPDASPSPTREAHTAWTPQPGRLPIAHPGGAHSLAPASPHAQAPPGLACVAASSAQCRSQRAGDWASPAPRLGPCAMSWLLSWLLPGAAPWGFLAQGAGGPFRAPFSATPHRSCDLR